MERGMLGGVSYLSYRRTLLTGGRRKGKDHFYWEGGNFFLQTLLIGRKEEGEK